MNIIGKIGVALLISGALIINGFIILTILRLIFGESFPVYIQVALIVIVTGLILMLLSAVRDRYKSTRTEEVHRKY